jgi:hypothetical protein
MTTMPAPAPDQLALDLAAFDRTTPLREALPPEQVPPYSLDAMYAVGKALQIAARLVPFRPQLAALPGFDLSHLDRFEDLARALRFAQIEMQRRQQKLKEMPALVAEGYSLRGLMLAHAEALSFKNVVAPELVARVREGSGHRDLAEDLTVLASELRSITPSVLGPGAPATPDDVARAATVAHQILQHLGLTEKDLAQAALVDARAQTAALLLRSHAQLRRAMNYLRFDEGDAAELVPSLYVPGGRPSKPAADPAEALAAVHEHLHEDDDDAPADDDGPFSED